MNATARPDAPFARDLANAERAQVSGFYPSIARALDAVWAATPEADRRVGIDGRRWVAVRRNGVLTACPLHELDGSEIQALLPRRTG